MLRTSTTAVVTLALLLAGTAGLGRTPDADAAWRLTSVAAPATAAAITMPTGHPPTVTGTNLGAAGYSYTITWPSVPMTNGHPVTGYLISRAMTGGATLLAGGSCAPVNLLGVGFVSVVPATAGSSQSCVETSLVSLGTPRYQVTPVYGNWRGTPSGWAAAS